MKLISKIFLVMSLCSCGTTEFIEPTTGPLARITFVNMTGYQYGVGIFKNHETCQGVIGGGPSDQKIKSFSTNIVADAPLSFHMGLHGGSSYCGTLATFNPEKDNNYLAVISHANGGCNLSLTEKSGDGSKPVEWKKRESIPRLTNNSSFCK